MNIRLYSAVVILCVFISTAFPRDASWKKEKLSLRLGNEKEITGIYYAPGKKPKFKEEAKAGQVWRKKITPERFKLQKAEIGHDNTVFASVINSPPIDGFVPWIAISATDKNISDDFTAYVENSYSGLPLIGDAAHNFAIGLFDTGASAHVIGYASSLNLGITGNYLSPSTTVLGGVSGTVDAWVSYPIGIFAAGLGAISAGTLDLAKLKGESNVTVAVGMEPVGGPDVATAIGSPFSVFYTTVFDVENPVTVIHDGNTYTAPAINIYEHDDPAAASYSNSIPLELRPLGSTSVQYVPSLEYNENFEFYPATPSILTGNLSQSLFFVSSVDMVDGIYSAIDRQRFMFDTGAQITVIGSRVGARLGLDKAKAEFEVEITGVTGEVTSAPGFYVDKLEIPALGDWMSFTNIPVVLLDISSPEGGTLDGIIGMNLLLEMNFVLRGGGLMLEPDPVLEYQLISAWAVKGDIAPAGGDGMVDYKDLVLLASCWLATQESANWDPDCDIVPAITGTTRINFEDFASLSANWLSGY